VAGFGARIFQIEVKIICSTKLQFTNVPAMLYQPLLATGLLCFSGVGADILIPPFWFGDGLLRRRDVYSCEV